MTGLGILLIVLGAGSLLLPMFDIQFRIMELVDPWQPWAGIVVAIVGVALVLFGMNRQPTTTVEVNQAPPDDPARQG
ncbi:MAG: hypothetical protein ACRDGD_06410 [Candidatus Limnocylindria bacterium]